MLVVCFDPSDRSIRRYDSRTLHCYPTHECKLAPGSELRWTEAEVIEAFRRTPHPDFKT